MGKHNEINPVQNWVENDKKLADVLVEIQQMPISINEQAEVTFHKISEMYNAPKLPEDIEESETDEMIEATCVYEQLGLLKYMEPETDLRGHVLSAIFFVKNDYRVDLELVYKKEFGNIVPKNVCIGFKGDNTNVEIMFVKQGDNWLDLECKMFIKSV